MLLFRHSFKIKFNAPPYQVIRLLEDTVDTERKFIWPWKKRKPFRGSIAGNAFKISTNSYFRNYRPDILGKIVPSNKITYLNIIIKQTSIGHLAVVWGVLFFSTVFLFLSGTGSEAIIPAIFAGLFYYLVCLFLFTVDTLWTKRKIKKIFLEDSLAV